MVGLARRLARGPVVDLGAFKVAYENLLADKTFIEACGRGTTSEERVKNRTNLATAAFAALA